MRRLSVAQFGLLLAMAIFLPGCARFPSGSGQTSIRELSFSIVFNSQIDDNAFYYIPIDITGGATGPQPVFANPDGSSGEEWVTGSATHYVMYHANDYTVYKITSLHPFSSQPIGRPVKYTLPSGGNTLAFSLDLSSIGATSNSVNINIIALNQLSSYGRLLDALGRRGTDFVNIDITSTRTFRNQDLLTPEAAGDVLDQNGFAQPATDQTKPIDIVDWTINTNI